MRNSACLNDRQCGGTPSSKQRYTAEAPPVDGKPFLPICTTPVVLANYADTVADEKLDLEQGAAS